MAWPPSNPFGPEKCNPCLRNVLLPMSRNGQLAWVALVMVEPTFDQIVLMLVAMFGLNAPAVTAMNPAINAYSTRSCPQVSRQTTSFTTKLLIAPTRLAYPV
jgi:hypothetical protein